MHALAGGGPPGRRPPARAREGRHRDAPGRRRPGRRAGAGQGRPGRAGPRARRAVDPPGGGRRRRRRGPLVHRRPAPAVRCRAWPPAAPGSAPGPARRQLGRRRSPGRRPATTSSAAGSPSTACSRRRPSPAALEAATGESLRPALSLRARVAAVRRLDASERPSYGRLRPLPDRVGGGDRPARLRRRRAAGALRRRVLRAHRRPAPAAGRHGHDGPDRRRLRARTPPWPSATRSRCSGSQGDEAITADEWARCSARSATRCSAGSGRGCPGSYDGDRPGPTG